MPRCSMWSRTCHSTLSIIQSEPPSQNKLGPSGKGDIITSRAFSPSHAGLRMLKFRHGKVVEPAMFTQKKNDAQRPDQSGASP